MDLRPSADCLIFSASAWPAARVVRSAEVETKFRKVAATFKAWRSHTVRASGKGKHWSTSRPLGFWRDFADLDVDDADAVTDLVRRRGDPLGQLDGKKGETESGQWIGLGGSLRAMAQAWEVEDADGISRLTDDPDRLHQASSWWRHFALPDYAKQVELIADPAGGTRTALRPTTLAAFMVLSAGSALNRKVPMKRCEHCHSWFELLRSDARFCTASCRALSSARIGHEAGP